MKFTIIKLLPSIYTAYKAEVLCLFVYIFLISLSLSSIMCVYTLVCSKGICTQAVRGGCWVLCILSLSYSHMCGVRTYAHKQSEEDVGYRVFYHCVIPLTQSLS